MNLSPFSLEQLRYGARLRPSRDWFLVLGIFALAFAAVLAWNISAFDTVAAGGVLRGAATSTPPVFSQSSLDTIHKIFADRATEEAKYATGVYRYADPSK